MRKTIGILGGMGPEASGYLYRLLIEKAISDFDAKHNDDFPEILLHSIPVPDFIASDDKKHEALRMLQDRVRLLNDLDISCLAIACNTAHILLPELQRVTQVPFVSMIEAVISRIKRDGLQKIGILGTPSTLRTRLYKNALREAGIASVEPQIEDYPILEQAIRHVIAGTSGQQDKDALRVLADTLREQGAEGIILGCTELPLVLPTEYVLPVYNSVEILALELLKKYYTIQKDNYD